MKLKIIDHIDGSRGLPKEEGNGNWTSQHIDLSTSGVLNFQNKLLFTEPNAIVEAGGGTIEFNDIMPNPVNTDIEYPWATPIEIGFKEPLVLTELKD